MKINEKVAQLKEIIDSNLRDLIDDDYLLLDLPYYQNIGDTLIWAGELEFLQTFRYRCLNKGFRYTNTSHVTDSTLILMQGGGNFGDLWRQHQEYRLSVIEKYARNKILIFPVTVGYESMETMKYDAAHMARHPNLTICVRDVVSYQLLKSNFKNNILLVPDMAFYIPAEKLNRFRLPEIDKILLLKRTDKELASNFIAIPNEVGDNIELLSLIYLNKRNIEVPLS